ncbi:hypothetical protein COO60DRAFT_364987 [Scenedesmus sp. NREL 46B-D3]|nr:hypothetical protein COO60DRAFT_364987 [Scenedesmus sp. NREL 46B-D3]
MPSFAQQRQQQLFTLPADGVPLLPVLCSDLSCCVIHPTTSAGAQQLLNSLQQLQQQPAVTAKSEPCTDHHNAPLQPRDKVMILSPILKPFATGTIMLVKDCDDCAGASVWWPLAGCCCTMPQPRGQHQMRRRTRWCARQWRTWMTPQARLRVYCKAALW